MDVKEKYLVKCITDADNGISRLTEGILKLDGMSSFKIRHLLNNVLSIPDIPEINYLEIGVYKGSTFVSALYKNKVHSSYAIDDWSQFEGDNSAFKKACKTYDIVKYHLIEKDAFKVDLSNIMNKINIYFYDGHHSRESTFSALAYYYPVLTYEFILIVDDYDWSDPHKGIMMAISKLKLEIVFSDHLRSSICNDADGWWNGVGVFILRKR